MKTLLALTRCSFSTGKVTLNKDISFSVMMNPDSLKHHQAIQYNKEKPLGNPGVEVKFDSVGTEKLSFSIWLDATGAVPQAGPDRPADVMTQLRMLRRVVYEYEGKAHEPGHVRLLWGTLIFFGRMETISTEYKLFRPSGHPLRAKVDLSFIGSMSQKARSLEANRSSPDLNHRIVVREGDRLPLLCHSIYGDSSYYPEVARHNRLVQFRELVPGTVLDFPPLQ